MRVVNRNSQSGVIFIEQDSRDKDKVWRKVEAASANGSRLWLHAPLLHRLNGSLGSKLGHKHWLRLEPRTNQKTEWLFRARDVILSALALGVLSPVFFLVAILIKLSSPGPVFYRTRVVGQAGESFVWSKFRSMRAVPESYNMADQHERFRAFAEGQLGVKSDKSPIKAIDEKRITPVGRFIRKHSIDEWPQLWNVLRGQMSLVGPRPCLPHEAVFFTGWQRKRFSVPPGLTGVWQVFGRGRAGFEESAAMDVYYFYRRSFGFDLLLMLKTVGVMLTGKGAK